MYCLLITNVSLLEKKKLWYYNYKLSKYKPLDGPAVNIYIIIHHYEYI